MKPDRPAFEQYYEIQYRTVELPDTWQCFGPNVKGIYKSFVDAVTYVQGILNNIKLAKEVGVHEPYCVEYRVVERKVTTETEVLKTFNVE
jgi:hypothetical protein